MRNLLLATSVVAGFAGIATSASAQTATGFNVLGGGSSLAVNLYNRTAQAIATANNTGLNVLTQGINVPGAIAGSTQGELGYQADGSGSGQKAFIQQTIATHSNYAGEPAGTPVAFGASDAYLTSDQVACWSGTAANCTAAGYATPTVAPVVAGGPLIQLPAFGTAIVIAHTNQYLKGIQLDDNDLCGIFSGKITDWSGVETAPGKTAPLGYAGKISVFYRQDGSGTSFLFTQHLAKVCNSTNTATGVTFVPTKYFADVFGAPTVSGSNHTIPASLIPTGSSFTAAGGSTGIADALIGGVNYVSYLTPDFTKIAPGALSHYQKFATLNNTPIGSVTAVQALTSPYQGLFYAKVYNSHSGKAFKPNAGGASTAFKNANTTDFNPGYPQTKAAASDPTQWVPAIADPLDGYPIVGFTTLDLATCYSSPAVQNYVLAFLSQLYGSNNKTNLTAEGFTGVPSGYAKTISYVFVKPNKSTYALNIGNPSVCNQLSVGHKGL